MPPYASVMRESGDVGGDCATFNFEKETIVKDFRHLNVWTKAHALTLALYRESRGFPSRMNSMV